MTDDFYDGESDDYFWGGDGSDPDIQVRAHVEAALVQSDEGYAPPVDRLLTLGEPTSIEDMGARINELGLSQEHVPDLVRMTRDRALNTAPMDGPEVWAPINALYALGNLDVTAHVTDLIPLFDVDMEWFGERLPDVLWQAGAVALEPLAGYVHDRSRWLYGRSHASNTIRRIGQEYPELRDRAVAIIVEELEHARENPEGLNGFLLSDLLELNAVEALPTIRRAFEADAVEEFIVGDWETVLTRLGQTPDPADPLIPRSRARWQAANAELRASLAPIKALRGAARSPARAKDSKQAKQKHKRKLEKAARKANRSKKKRK